ncbi:MAG: DUF4145 domain-containing protein [Bacteroidales bacterium]|nr:DUF4145 domain-containing protein [Bacteroidales bacterium]
MNQEILHKKIKDYKDYLSKENYQNLELAFKYIKTDPQGSLVKTRSILEIILNEIYIIEMEKDPKKPEIGTILNDNQFKKKIERNIATRMNSVRDMGNLGAHGIEVKSNDASDILAFLCEIIDWYLRKYKEIEPIIGRSEKKFDKLINLNKKNKIKQLKIIKAIKVFLSLIFLFILYFAIKEVFLNKRPVNNSMITKSIPPTDPPTTNPAEFRISAWTNKTDKNAVFYENDTLLFYVKPSMDSYLRIIYETANDIEYLIVDNVYVYADEVYNYPKNLYISEPFGKERIHIYCQTYRKHEFLRTRLEENGFRIIIQGEEYHNNRQRAKFPNGIKGLSHENSNNRIFIDHQILTITTKSK